MITNKTETIKQRAIYVYTPSEEIAEKWKDAAKKSGISISKFIIEIVEDNIQTAKCTKSKDVLEKRIEDLKKQNDRLQQENNRLQKKVDMLDILTDKYEKQLQDYRNKTFIEDDTFEGVREYQQNLIELFKQKTSINEEEIIDLLHIDPNNTEALKAISIQIEKLQDYGVVEKIRGGWRWKR